MTFASAINSTRPGDAVKRPSWLGYVYKDVKSKTDNVEDSVYDIVIVDKDGAKHVYPFGTDTEGSPVMLSPALLDGFMRDDWDRGPIELFEKARAGGDF